MSACRLSLLSWGSLLPSPQTGLSPENAGVVGSVSFSRLLSSARLHLFKGQDEAVFSAFVRGQLLRLLLFVEENLLAHPREAQLLARDTNVEALSPEEAKTAPAGLVEFLRLQGLDALLQRPRRRRSGEDDASSAFPRTEDWRGLASASFKEESRAASAAEEKGCAGLRLASAWQLRARRAVMVEVVIGALPAAVSDSAALRALCTFCLGVLRAAEAAFSPSPARRGPGLVAASGAELPWGSGGGGGAAEAKAFEAKAFVQTAAACLLAVFEAADSEALFEVRFKDLLI